MKLNRDLGMSAEELERVGVGFLGLHAPQPGFAVPLPLGERQRAAPKDETVEEPAPKEPVETEHKRFLRESAELEAKILKVKADLFALARARGVDPNAPAVDPAPAPARSVRKELIDRVAQATEERRARKARERAAKSIRKLGL